MKHLSLSLPFLPNFTPDSLRGALLKAAERNREGMELVVSPWNFLSATLSSSHCSLLQCGVPLLQSFRINSLLHGPFPQAPASLAVPVQALYRHNSFSKNLPAPLRSSPGTAGKPLLQHLGHFSFRPWFLPACFSHTAVS